MSHGRTLRKRITTIITSIFLASLIVTSVQADLVLSAPPRESAADGNKVYGALANYLSRELGEKVVYQHPDDWFSYQKGIRSDKYDIVFDGPHFISWRMKNKGHTPVAKLPGDLGFVLIAKSDDEEIRAVKDLAGEKVCGISPPNLSTLTVLKEYGNEGRPKLITVKGGMPSVYNAFKEGKCNAAVLRDKFYSKKVSESDRAETKIIFSSKPVPNQGVTVSTRVSNQAKKKIADVLTRRNSGTEPLLNRFAPKADKMSSVNESEYEPYYKLLSGVVIGW